MFRKLYDWTLAWARSRHATTALGTISFVESSVFPIPADVLFIPMCAARPDRAMRLAFIASVTSVLGGIFGWFIGYFAFEWLARPLLEFYHKLDTFEAMRADVAGSTWLILVLLVTSGLAHLPPMKVVTILSGVVGFSLPLFILSAIVARGGRFYALAWLLRRYGEPILAFIERRLTLIVAVVIALLVLLYFGLKTL
ncbi:DedA family protein [Frigidibacter sp. RF13]|uniref:YqaA family protein n=1 Tax=Frigidibacter sp. RF13 TaxID=2997340 RepID=UPI00227005B9|nr:YqaA family protein [Frigidibacter sp. RF13]MCY1125413.1 DedA family protein [Frigidibacter sp. RF13]